MLIMFLLQVKVAERSKRQNGRRGTEWLRLYSAFAARIAREGYTRIQIGTPTAALRCRRLLREAPRMELQS